LQELLWVGAGGFAGAVLRYLVGRSVAGWSRQTGFPIGTLAVNVVGCLLIGLLSHLVEARGLFSGEARAFVLVGTLGAFTTFSTFSNETTVFIRQGQPSMALLNVGIHLTLGLVSVQAGRSLARWVW
jgi:fluoride exporter